MSTVEESVRLDRFASVLEGGGDLLQWRGTVKEITGLVVESQGPPSAVGSFCEIRTSRGRSIRTQVAGFRNGRILSIPLEEVDGLEPGDPIYARSNDAQVRVGPELLGRVLDGFGLPMDGGPPIESPIRYDLYAAPPGPLEREHIQVPKNCSTTRAV
jgi:flagellum-specific ATP synthase